MKELFNFKSTLCEEAEFLPVHHIDGDFKYEKSHFN